MLKGYKLLNVFCKNTYSTQAPKYVIEQLTNRSLIRVAGPEAKDYLQGLITNDINHLGQSSGGSLYSLFLNTKGRVLYDSIIYKKEPNSYLVECDAEGAQALAKHLKIFRVRRKVDVNIVQNEFNIFVMFDLNTLNLDKFTDNSQKLEGIVMPCDALESNLPDISASTKIYKNLFIFKDPRLNELGSRVISKIGTNIKQEISEVVGNVEFTQPSENYKTLRYYLGIGEGINDLPYGECFPLESNCDYLHGVSFHKGCYIGQELTARTYHTGVVRKRLMPLYFTSIPSKLPTENKIIHEEVNLGKLRGIEGNMGLALLRINQALDFGEITVGDGKAKVRKPLWWPTENSRERLKIDKS